MLILLFRYCHYFCFVCFVFTVISSFVFIDITTALDLVYAKNELKGDLTVEKWDDFQKSPKWQILEICQAG